MSLAVQQGNIRSPSSKANEYREIVQHVRTERQRFRCVVMNSEARSEQAQERSLIARVQGLISERCATQSRITKVPRFRLPERDCAIRLVSDDVTARSPHTCKKWNGEATTTWSFYLESTSFTWCWLLVGAPRYKYTIERSRSGQKGNLKRSATGPRGLS